MSSGSIDPLLRLLASGLSKLARKFNITANLDEIWDKSLLAWRIHMFTCVFFGTDEQLPHMNHGFGGEKKKKDQKNKLYI